MAVNMDEQQNLEEYCKRLLHSTIFLGNYTERRWVPHLNRYKDVIVLAQTEHELRSKLFKLRLEVHNHYQGIKTSNIVLASDFTMLYTKLPFGCPFGTHWFKISHAKVDSNEKDVTFKIKIVRSVDQKDFENPNQSFETKPEDNFEMLWSDVIQRLKFAFTVPNVIQCMRIVLLVILTVGMGFFVAIKSTAQFVLKFFREISNFVRSSTPLLLGVSNILTKIFGGILILLSMVWKDVFYLARRKIDPDGTPARADDSHPRPARLPALTLYDNQYNTPVSRQFGMQQRYPRRGVKITELPNE